MVFFFCKRQREQGVVQLADLSCEAPGGEENSLAPKGTSRKRRRVFCSPGSRAELPHGIPSHLVLLPHQLFTEKRKQATHWLSELQKITEKKKKGLFLPINVMIQRTECSSCITGAGTNDSKQWGQIYTGFSRIAFTWVSAEMVIMKPYIIDGIL